MAVAQNTDQMQAGTGPAENGMINTIRAKATESWDDFQRFTDPLNAYAEEVAEEKLGGDSVVHRASQRATIVAIVGIAAVAMVGNKILSEVDNTIDVQEGTQYANASEDIAGGFVDSMGLVGLVMLVLIASIVIGVISQF